MHLVAVSISSSLLTMGIPLGEKVIRTVAVYAGLVVLLRVGGKRVLAQLTALDLVVLLLLSNVVQNAIIGGDNSLTGGLIGAAVLLCGNSLLNHAVRHLKGPLPFLEGRPTALAENGAFRNKGLGKLGLRDEDVTLAIRQQGASSVEEVQHVDLYPHGSMVIDFKPGAENATKQDLVDLEERLTALLAGGQDRS